MRASFTPQEVHKDWPETVHGRIITALLYKQGTITITMMRGMEAKLGPPASVGKKLLAESWLEERSGRELSVHSELTDEDGKLIAQGSASLVVLSQEQIDRKGMGA